MREIKFRAWDKEEGKMYEVYGISFPEKRVIGIIRSDGKMRTFGIEYIMQSTGLTDRNNREIYEGDVVLWAWGDRRGKEIVKWSQWQEEMSEGIGFQFPWFCVSDSSCEVIGNIYENPEFMKGSL